MRRISLALALVSAFAAGCSGGKAPTEETGTGTAKGVVGQYYFINIFAAPSGGYIKAATAGVNIDCSADAGHTACGVAGQTQVTWDTTVLLQAFPASGKAFIGWAGDCSGAGDCVLSAGADKQVVAIFGAPGSGHTNLTDPGLHGPAYVAQTLDCARCHGPTLLGQSIAPSCGVCHEVPPLITAPMGVVLGKHFEAAGHNSGACARCHSGSGFRDYIGADGTASNVETMTYTSTGGGVNPAPPAPPVAGVSVDGQTFTSGMGCDMCHNSATVLGGGTLDKHRFPSGNLVTMDGNTAICAQCHDGGRPGYEVSQLAVNIGTTAADAQISTATAGTNKTVRAHYVPAASTLFGAAAANFSQVGVNIYTAKNAHGGKGSCVDCHDPHSGLLPADAEIEAKCGACHFDELSGLPVKNFLELEESRQFGFEGDIDGDAAIESIKAEIDGLAAKTYAAIQEYAKQMTPAPGTEICIANNRAYVLANSGVACNVAPNTVEFAKYTPRLLKAVYNYLLWQNDLGAWAHNPRYIVEVLFDTTDQLNVGLVAAGKAPVANGKRAFNGHFGAAEDASPYAAMTYHGPAAPPMGFTSAACYQCHGGAGGLAEFLAAPTTGASLTLTNKVTALQCSTCHTDGADMKGIRADVSTLYFPPAKPTTGTPTPLPSGQVAITGLPTGFALCATCHSGRENKTSVDNAIANNYALSATGLVATGGTTTSVSVAAPAGGWKKNRYLNAKVTFTSGLNAGTSIVVTGPAADVAAGATATLTWTLALAEAPALGDGFDVVFDATTWGIGFTNPHYLGAAGILVGSNGHMLYEYAGQTYAGYPVNWSLTANGAHGSPHGSSCVGCHNPVQSKHTFEIDLATTVVDGTWAGGFPIAGMNPGDQNTAACTGCHAGPYALEPKKLEVEEGAAELYTAIQAYASGKGLSLCYNGASHPYWFADDDSDGTCSTAVQAKLDEKAAKAAYNFKWAHAEPGAYAHNLEYMMQGLYDAIVDLGGTPTFARPVVTP